MVLLAVPIVWLFLQVGGVFTSLVPIIILINLVIATIVIRKTGYYKLNQYSALHAAKRMEQALGSGLITIFVMGLITEVLVNPPTNHFWVYCAIFFVVGTIIGYILQI
jgi:hypothetical protein